MLRTTLSHFPNTAAELHDSGVPLGCIVRPLAPLPRDDDDDDDEDDADSLDDDYPTAAEIARCSGCGGYSYCDLQSYPPLGCGGG